MLLFCDQKIQVHEDVLDHNIHHPKHSPSFDHQIPYYSPKVFSHIPLQHRLLSRFASQAYWKFQPIHSYSTHDVNKIIFALHIHNSYPLILNEISDEMFLFNVLCSSGYLYKVFFAKNIADSLSSNIIPSNSHSASNNIWMYFHL